MKSKSVKFNTTTASINRIALQHNKQVIDLNNQLSTSVCSKTSVCDDPVPAINMTYTEKVETVSIGFLYPENDNIVGSNPINNVVKVETINYGNKLDYLYKKQLNKK
jgi:hypothetical protein